MKTENLSHRAMRLANKLKPAYSSFAAALKVAYSVLRSETVKQQVLKGLARAVHCLAKLGLEAESDNAFNAYMVLLVL